MNSLVGLPDDVQIILGDLVRQSKKVLQDRFAGVYPYGSLAIGDFDPASSDLDLVVATSGKLKPGTIEAIAGLHADLDRGSNPWAQRLEVWYVPIHRLKRHDSAAGDACLCWSTHHPIEEAGQGGPVPTQLAVHDNLAEDWILNRATMWTGNRAFAGPPPRDLIDPIETRTIRSVVGKLLAENWREQCDGPAWMRPAKYQAFVVLTMCRALYALERGEVITKPRAAAWALEALDPKWVPLIRWALTHRLDPAPGDLESTLAFLRFSVDRGVASS